MPRKGQRTEGKNYRSKAKLKDRYSSPSLNCDVQMTRSGHDSPTLNVLGTLRDKVSQYPLTLALYPVLTALQTVIRHYSRAVDYWTYCLANRSTRWNEIKSSYVSRMVNNIKLEIKVHFFDPSDPIFTFASTHHSNWAKPTASLKDRLKNPPLCR